jgi:hypothetical protein
MSRFRGGWGARPENALKRAEELENVGQKAAALQSLRDVITSKRSRANWSKTYEDIMFKLMDLCVDMKRRNDAKEALMQYRNMCQQVNINSLEEVIKYYLNRATEKAEEARAQAEVRGVGGPGRVGGGRRVGGGATRTHCAPQQQPAAAVVHDLGRWPLRERASSLLASDTSHRALAAFGRSPRSTPGRVPPCCTLP